MDSGNVGTLSRLMRSFPQFNLQMPDTAALLDSLVNIGGGGSPPDTLDPQAYSDSLNAHRSRISAYQAGLAAFEPENEVQQVNKDLLTALINLEDSVSATRELIFELLNDTIPDESQQGLLDSLARLSHDIPPDIQDVLYALAGECLFEKGACVLTARSFFPDSLFYNACEEFIIPSARYAETRNDDQRNNKKEPDIIKVYPNPASDFFTVETPDSLSGIMLELFDVNGRLVIRENILQPVQRIFTRELSSGLYFYRVISTEKLAGKGLLMLDKSK